MYLSAVLKMYQSAVLKMYLSAVLKMYLSAFLKMYLSDVLKLYLSAVLKVSVRCSESLPVSCAIKMAATASYSAVPSMFIVAPIGRTNRDMMGSILFPFYVKKNIIILKTFVPKLSISNNFKVLSENPNWHLNCILSLKHVIFRPQAD